MTGNVLVLDGTNGLDTQATLQQVADNGRPGATIPLGASDRPDGAAPKGSADRPGVNTANSSVTDRPGVSKDTGANNSRNRTATTITESTDKLQWYHWLGIALVLSAIIYGVYYWYKKRQ